MSLPITQRAPATLSLVEGPGCPACLTIAGGIIHQKGLHQFPIVQCTFCHARIFVGDGDFRKAIPESKAPPIRPDFLTPRPFDDGLDGLNRQVATYEGEAAEHERKARYWRACAERAKAQRADYMSVGDRSENPESIRTVPVLQPGDQFAIQQVSEPGAQA